jgi:hypothetical protein
MHKLTSVIKKYKYVNSLPVLPTYSEFSIGGAFNSSLSKSAHKKICIIYYLFTHNFFHDAISN